MGTNYYLRTDVCPHCERAREHVHIGKSSVGWPFLFRGYRKWPPDGVPHPITSAKEWRAFISKATTEGKARIYDEYGHQIEPVTLWSLIESKADDMRGPLQSNYRHGERDCEWHDSEGHRFCDNEFS